MTYHRAIALLASCVALGCDAHFQLGDGCLETSCKPSSGAEKWYAAMNNCTCSLGAHAELQRDGIVICRCPVLRKDAGR